MCNMDDVLTKNIYIFFLLSLQIELNFLQGNIELSPSYSSSNPLEIIFLNQ